jgi:hypothetical protein
MGDASIKYSLPDSAEGAASELCAKARQGKNKAVSKRSRRRRMAAYLS